MSDKEERNYAIKQKSCFVISDKNIEYELTLSIYNNDVISFTASSTKLVPSKKI